MQTTACYRGADMTPIDKLRAQWLKSDSVYKQIWDIVKIPLYIGLGLDAVGIVFLFVLGGLEKVFSQDTQIFCVANILAWYAIFGILMLVGTVAWCVSFGAVDMELQTAIL
jgi:hypothetical protein